jgi:hypothetical protein
MSKEAMKLALEALKGVLDDSPKVMEASISGGLYEVVQCRDAIKALEEALEEALAKQEQGEPVAFKIYKPTPPRHATPNVRDADLPWVYDQDPSSGNVASMWVTPVQTLRSKTWKTKEQ